MRRLRTVGLAAALVAGFAVATLSGGTASTGGEAALLREAWDVQKTASLYNKWRAQNKGEADKLDAYWAGGPQPSLVTAYGRSWVLVADAYWSLRSPPTTTETTGPAPTPTPRPSGFASPIGYLSNRTPGFFPPTNLDQYGVISSEGPAPTGFRGVNLVYRSGITCGAGYTNFSEAECVANGWAMRDSFGNLLRNAGYGGVLADPGNTSYEQAWCQRSATYLNEHAADGAWIDDTNPRITSLTGGPRPANYPTDAGYETALLSFAQALQSCLAPFKTAYNTMIPLDDNASLTAAWWSRIGQYADYLTAEFWLNPGGYIRRTGAEWFNHWDEHRALHRVCQQIGTGFLPLMGGGGTQVQNYGLGTFLLDWDGTAGDGAAMWTDTDQYNSTTDPWSTFYAQAISLGQPFGAAIQTGTVWTRQFERGTLTVDSAAGTTSIGP